MPHDSIPGLPDTPCDCHLRLTKTTPGLPVSRAAMERLGLTKTDLSMNSSGRFHFHVPHPVPTRRAHPTQLVPDDGRRSEEKGRRRPETTGFEPKFNRLLGEKEKSYQTKCF